jgi:SAM-dependent methyltransferase
MSQRTTGLYRLTQMPQLYAGLQNMLGGSRTRDEIVTQYLRPQTGHSILDIGCGSASLLSELGEVTYTGLDLNPRHIEAARLQHSTKATFYCGTLSGLSEIVRGPFDIAMCIGVLHHLADQEVGELCSLVAQRLKQGGRFVAIDPAFVNGQNPIARWLATRDSGQAVRTPDGYANLAKPHFQNVEISIRHNMLRVPYTHCILEASNA